MTRRRLLRAAQMGGGGGDGLSARELHAQLELPVSVSRFKQLLTESPTLKFLSVNMHQCLPKGTKQLVLSGVLRDAVCPMKIGQNHFFRTKRSLIWMDQMDSKAIGTT